MASNPSSLPIWQEMTERPPVAFGMASLSDLISETNTSKDSNRHLPVLCGTAGSSTTLGRPKREGTVDRDRQQVRRPLSVNSAGDMTYGFRVLRLLWVATTFAYLKNQSETWGTQSCQLGTDTFKSARESNLIIPSLQDGSQVHCSKASEPSNLHPRATQSLPRTGSMQFTVFPSGSPIETTFPAL